MQILDGTIRDGPRDDASVSDGVIVVRDEEMAVTVEEHPEMTSGRDIVGEDGVREEANREAIDRKLIMGGRIEKRGGKGEGKEEGKQEKERLKEEGVEGGSHGGS